MGSEQFDEMTRGLASGGTTRRRMLRNAVGAMAGAALAGFGVRPALAAKGGHHGPKGNKGNKGPNSPRGPLGNPNPDGGVCDNCEAMCSNCPLACC